MSKGRGYGIVVSEVAVRVKWQRCRTDLNAAKRIRFP